MKTISKTLAGVKVVAGVKAGGLTERNHNRRTLAVKSNVKAGSTIALSNHSRPALAVKTNVKAGSVIVSPNHNRRLA